MFSVEVLCVVVLGEYFIGCDFMVWWCLRFRVISVYFGDVFLRGIKIYFIFIVIGNFIRVVGFLV